MAIGKGRGDNAMCVFYWNNFPKLLPTIFICAFFASTAAAAALSHLLCSLIFCVCFGSLCACAYDVRLLLCTQLHIHIHIAQFHRSLSFSLSPSLSVFPLHALCGLCLLALVRILLFPLFNVIFLTSDKYNIPLRLSYTHKTALCAAPWCTLRMTDFGGLFHFCFFHLCFSSLCFFFFFFGRRRRRRCLDIGGM